MFKREVFSRDWEGGMGVSSTSPVFVISCPFYIHVYPNISHSCVNSQVSDVDKQTDETPPPSLDELVGSPPSASELSDSTPSVTPVEQVQQESSHVVPVEEDLNNTVRVQEDFNLLEQVQEHLNQIEQKQITPVIVDVVKDNEKENNEEDLSMQQSLLRGHTQSVPPTPTKPMLSYREWLVERPMSAQGSTGLLKSIIDTSKCIHVHVMTTHTVHVCIIS